MAVKATIEQMGRVSWYITVTWPLYPDAKPGTIAADLESVDESVILLGTRRGAERRARRMQRRRARLQDYKAAKTVVAKGDG